NAYCQDNETSWFDWTLLTKRADVHRFVSVLNARRVLRDVEHEEKRVALNQLLLQEDITWHGVKLGEPNWRHSSHSLAFTVKLTTDRTHYHIILNARLCDEWRQDRKSTRLNSSHVKSSYAVFCLKKKKDTTTRSL